MDLINFRQHRRCVDHTVEVGRAQRSADAAKRELHDLENFVERLSLTCRAMWELLRDSTDLTEDDLIAKVQDLDLQDGKADGRLNKTVADCPQCGRPNHPSRDTCLYCNAPLPKDSAFDAL